MMRKLRNTKKFKVFLLSLLTFLFISIIAVFASEAYTLFYSLYSKNDHVYSLKQSDMVFFNGNKGLNLVYPDIFNNFNGSAFNYFFTISLLLSAVLIIFMFIYFYKLIEGNEGVLSTLKSVEKSMLEMPSTILHEIKGNINALSINSRILSARVSNVKDFESEKGEIGKISGTIEAETDKLIQTMNNILKFSKDYSLNIEEVNMLDILSKATEVLVSKAESKGINLLISVDKNIFMRMDRDLMEQVFINLISNAIESYENSKGEVLIYSVFYLKKIFIIIEDHGKGIKKEIIGKIYEPFFTTKNNGVGLGLSLVRKILDAHGFDISVESSIGKGTKLSLIFKNLDN